MNRIRNLLAVAVVLAAGCAGRPVSRSAPGVDSFGPVSMRVHPIFTRVLDKRPGEASGTVLVLVELVDGFGDPTKAMGRVMLELYEYRPREAEPRGQRVGGPWIFPLDDRERQVEHWNRITDAYEFRLDVADLANGRSYVLAAQFDAASGGRFFDQLVLTAASGERHVEPTTQPSTQPRR